MSQIKYTIYTIGYSAFSVEDFLDVLVKYNIDCVVDVRSSPYSSHYKQYDKENLESKLKSIGKYYRNYSREFGARQQAQEFTACEGYLDFEKFTQSKQFNEGVEKLDKSCKKGYAIVLMCAEKDPITCHRCIMIGRALDRKGFVVKHILYNKEVELQSESEDRILAEFCKKRGVERYQSSMLPNAIENMSDEQLLKLAYKDKNVEIGYRRSEG